jgi:hypothetical protein
LAEGLRGPLPQRERNTLISANLWHLQRRFVDGLGTRGKFVVIYSPKREFIVGDGFFNNFGSVSAPHHPKMLELGASHLVLPVRPAAAVEAPFTIPVIHAGLDQPGQGASKTGYANGLEWVKTPISKPSLGGMPTRDSSGRIRWDRDAESNSTFIEAVGTTSTTKSRRIVEITEGHPDSCRMQFAHMNRWQRGAWDCTIDFGAELTADANEFQLREWVIAKKGDFEIFRRETPSTIKRDLL